MGAGEYDQILKESCHLHDPDLKIVMKEIDKSEFRQGKDAVVYGISQSPFGEYYIALVPDGIASLQFTDGRASELVEDLRQRRGYCWLSRDDKQADMFTQIFLGHKKQDLVRICVRGTPFQYEVWSALMDIPFGQTVTYAEVAKMIGKPKAVRAVASAIAQNQLAYVIPCHRVVRSDGSVGDYRWGGAERKAAMIAWEKRLKAEIEKGR